MSVEETWLGWTLAGVPDEIRNTLLRRGITHRLIGLLGSDVVGAEARIREVFRNEISGDAMAAVIRAWRLGAHVVALEVQSYVWSPAGVCVTTDSHGASSSALMPSPTKKCKTSFQPRKVGVLPSGEAGQEEALRLKHQSERMQMAHEMLRWAKEVPEAWCWTLMAGRGSGDDVMLKWFEPSKASTRTKHVGELKRLQRWCVAHGKGKWDWRAEVLSDYFADRQSEPCGPTVPSSILTAVNHVGDLLGLEQGGRDSILKRESIRWAADAARPVKRAKSYTLEFVGLLEAKLADEELPLTLRVVCGTIRLMVGASLRQHDLQHTRPKEAYFEGSSLFGRCWATKTTGAHQGRVWACSGEHVSRPGWLKVYWDLFSKSTGTFNRDHWLPVFDIESDAFLTVPAEYSDMLGATRWALGKIGVVDAEGYGCHSAKPTLITWALCAGERPENVRLQGGWKDERMLDVYNRASMMVPADMSARVLRAVREGRVNHELADNIGMWLRNVVDSQGGGQDSVSEVSGTRPEANGSDKRAGPHDDDWLDEPLILSETRVHRPMLDSGCEEFPAGRTSCGLLLGSSNGLLRYELGFRMSDIGQRQLCSHCV